MAKFSEQSTTIGLIKPKKPSHATVPFQFFVNFVASCVIVLYLKFVKRLTDTIRNLVSVWEDQTKVFHRLAGNFCLELTTLQASCCGV